MGFRFRKTIKLFPGVRLNLSKSGVSTSIGKSGFTVNLKGEKTTTTVGIPGTGLSYRSSSTGIEEPEQGSGSILRTLVWLILIVGVIVLIFR